MTVVENTPAAWSDRALLPAPWSAAAWSENGQTQRFLAVLHHLELRSGDTLLDYGAGPGRFCEFLPRDIDYHAYDTSVGMRERCQRDHERATVLDTVPPMLFDHVVAVGCFNLPGSVADTFQQVALLWHESVRRTLVVSLYRGDDLRCLIYDPAVVASWAKTLGARRYTVDAHMDNDVILGMSR